MGPTSKNWIAIRLSPAPIELDGEKPARSLMSISSMMSLATRPLAVSTMFAVSVRNEKEKPRAEKHLPRPGPLRRSAGDGRWMDYRLHGGLGISMMVTASSSPDGPELDMARVEVELEDLRAGACRWQGSRTCPAAPD